MIVAAVLISWQQVVAVSIVLIVLFSITTGKIRYDITAFGGLLIIGLLKIVPVTNVFQGFSSPALFTVGSVMILSKGLINSGLFNGLGKWIGKKIKKPKGQVRSLSLFTAVLSTFMNNVGAIGIFLPISKRMAKRCDMPYAIYGVPLVYASIIGGSITLIGTASNIIVSSYRLSELGEAFHMFDFAYHGIPMLLAALLLWSICQLCGYKPLKVKHDDIVAEQEQEEVTYTSKTKQKLIAFLSMIIVIVMTSLGVMHSAIGFGLIVVVFVATKILSPKEVYESLSMQVMIFIGSMISLGKILEEIGVLDWIVDGILPLFNDLPPILAIYFVLLLAALIANAIDNSVSAVLLSPIVISMAVNSPLSVSPDALLMAVAAGASLGFVLPTHQVTLMAMTRIENFSRAKFIKNGFVLAIFISVVAAFMIEVVWN